jgi:hypothetical protein
VRDDDDFVSYEDREWMDAHTPLRQELRPKLGFSREAPTRFDAACALAKLLYLPTRGMDRNCCQALIEMMNPLADAVRDGFRSIEIDAATTGHSAAQSLIDTQAVIDLIGFFKLGNTLQPPVYIDRLDQELRDHAGDKLTKQVARLLQSWADQRRSGPPSARRRAHAR